MYELEIFMFFAFCFLTGKFLCKWYEPLLKAWPPDRGKATRCALGVLPFVALIIIFYTLKVLAAFDVVGSPFYILYYILFGYAWLYFGLPAMSLFFDISWQDDALHLNNKGALVTVAGGFLGLTIIYSGANIGDGPGWWCVLFAGGLGAITWICLGAVVNLLTKTGERITVERNLYCGIRFGFYLYASGMILGRASAGDWGSFALTIEEFMAGWPVLLLTALAVLIELFYLQREKSEYPEAGNHLFGSIFCGFIYVMFAGFSILLLPPLTQHPIYASLLRLLV